MYSFVSKIVSVVFSPQIICASISHTDAEMYFSMVTPDKGTKPYKTTTVSGGGDWNDNKNLLKIND